VAGPHEKWDTRIHPTEMDRPHPDRPPKTSTPRCTPRMTSRRRWSVAPLLIASLRRSVCSRADCGPRRALGLCKAPARRAARSGVLERRRGWSAQAEQVQPGAWIRSPMAGAPALVRRPTTRLGEALVPRAPQRRVGAARVGRLPSARSCAREQPQVSADRSGHTAGRLRWASAGHAMATITSHATERPVFPDASRPLTITIR